ncbi:MAG: glycosyltransferase family 4 protein [archaeon]
MNNWIHFVSSYPPRECGIATFTQDLVNSIEGKKNSGLECRVVALNENLYSTYSYPASVTMRIDQDDRESYLVAAEKLNKCRKTKAVCLQHEFGLFGGEYGEFIIPFLEELEKPVVTTFHSILPGNPEPERHRKYVVKKICQRSAKVVSISGYGKDILMDKYGIPEEKIAVVPHGIPEIPFREEAKAKKELGLQGRKVLSTFGLMDRRKGIHFAIRAMPRIVEEHPEAMYLVIGETHPVVRKKQGERYRNYLRKLVNELELKDHVKFENRFLSLDELCKYIQATDVYITPYYDPNQISSGTLAYAVGSGTACVATPFLYAKDVLRHGRGILVKFKSSRCLADATNKVLSNRKLKLRLERNAYNYTRGWHWPQIGETYIELFNQACERR